MQGQVLFIGHGSPLNAIQSNDYTRALQTWAQARARPRAVLVVSAHWLTQGTCVSCQARPKQIYDFYGFPRELYQVKYPCPGDPALAEQVTRLLLPGSRRWGKEHPAWNMLQAECSEE